jgi:acylphosphatase
MSARRFVVTGRVQGVGYRYFVLQEATRLGLTGFARNLPDGSVEVVAEGPAAALETLRGLLLDGPSFARVENVSALDVPARDETGFHIR